MNKLVHGIVGIVVVIGFVLWQMTGNIIIVTVVAVIAEGIYLQSRLQWHNIKSRSHRCC
jgi:hypothetical protein